MIEVVQAREVAGFGNGFMIRLAAEWLSLVVFCCGGSFAVTG
jgi:hypothetical protein